MSKVVEIPENEEDLSALDRIYLYDRGQLPAGWRAPTQEERQNGEPTEVPFTHNFDARVPVASGGAADLDEVQAQQEEEGSGGEPEVQDPNDFTQALDAGVIKKDTVGNVKDWVLEEGLSTEDAEERALSALEAEEAKDEDDQRSSLVDFLNSYLDDAEADGAEDEG